jgi:hypothetical protein
MPNPHKMKKKQQSVIVARELESLGEFLDIKP